MFQPALVICAVVFGGEPEPSAKAKTPDHPTVITIGRADVIRMTATKNPQVDATRAEILRAQAQQGRVNAAKYPSFVVNLLTVTSYAADNTDADVNGARSRRNAYSDFSLDQVRPGFIGNAQMTMPLYTFGKIGLRGEAAEAAERAGKAQTEMTQADVVYTAIDIYESYLLAQEVHLFLQDIKGIAERSIEETQARLEAADPDTREGDLLRLKTAMAQARIFENRVVAGMNQAREGLRAYLSLPDNVTIEIQDKILVPVAESPGKLEGLIGLARENRPEFRALTAAIEAYIKLADANYADYYPDFFLGGLVSGAYTIDRDFNQSRYVFDPLGHFAAGMGIGARWTLDWTGASYRADEVMADVAKFEGLKKWAEQGIPAEVNKVYEDVVRARADIKEFDDALPSAKEWLIRSTADFSAGLGPSAEVSDAVTSFVLMTAGRMEAIYRLNLALAQLAKATGTLVEGKSSLYPGKG